MRHKVAWGGMGRMGKVRTSHANVQHGDTMVGHTVPGMPVMTMGLAALLPRRADVSARRSETLNEHVTMST